MSESSHRMQEKNPAKARSRAHILVVDDEINNCNVIAAQLQHEGYEIETVRSGEDALSAIDRRLPDLIILDAMMPGISGFDVAEILKAETRTATIPIIMLTALGDADSRLAALSNGVEEFLTKPVAKAELVMRVRNLLKLKNYQNDLEHYSAVLEGRVAESTVQLESASVRLNEMESQLLQAEKMAAIGQLAAGVAHEINNPVGFVNANLGTLKVYLRDILRVLAAYEGQLSECSKNAEGATKLEQLRSELDLDYLRDDAPHLIDESLEGLSRVCKIVQDLKRFAHADTNPTWETASVHECLDSALNIANNEIKYRATVVREYGDLPTIECLPSQLGQVFLNLLVNAAQAIPESSHGQIKVSTGVVNEDIWIEIADNGGGIPAENLNRIFEPFFTTKPVGEGTGLGLSLSYGIIKAHNGSISVCSDVGKGTTFHIRLPIHHG